MGAPEVPSEVACDNMLSHIAQGETKLPSARERARNTRIATLVPAYDSSDPEKILRGIAFNYMN